MRYALHFQEEELIAADVRDEASRFLASTVINIYYAPHFDGASRPRHSASAVRCRQRRLI